MIGRLSLLVAALGLLCGPAQAQILSPILNFGPQVRTFFASSAASGSGNGLSPASPWTLAQVNTGPGGGYQAGDSVLLTGSFSASSGIALTATQWATGPNAPTTARPVTFGTYGGGATITSAATTACFSTSNIGGIIWNGVNCTGRGVASDAVDGISIANTLTGGSANTHLPAITVENATIQGYGGNCVDISGSTVSSEYSGFTVVTVSGVVAQNCTGVAGTYGGSTTTGGIHIHANGAYGLAPTNVAFDTVKILNSTASGNTGVAGSGNWTGSGIIPTQSGAALIDESIAFNNGANGNNASGAVGIWCADDSACTIQRSESYLNHTSGGDGGGFDCDGGSYGCLVQYNYAHDNDGVGFDVVGFSGAGGSVTNATFRYNISQNNGAKNNLGEFQEYNGGASTFSGIKVYNNAFFGSFASTGGVVLASAGAAQGTFNNNIIASPHANNLIDTTGASSVAGLTFNFNDYYAPVGTYHFNYNGTAYTTTFAAFTSGAESRGKRPCG